MATIKSNKIKLSKTEWENIGVSVGWMHKEAMVEFDAQKVRKFVNRNHDLYMIFQQYMDMTDEQSALALMFENNIQNNPELSEKYLKVR
jgi:hypothetical protein